MTQFRWSQSSGAPELFSWALDDIYIGESCPGHCSGHGKCTKTLQCVCDTGYSGISNHSLISHYYFIISLFTMCLWISGIGGMSKTIYKCTESCLFNIALCILNIGLDCSLPVQRYIVPVFRENFERGQINLKRWRHLTGGVITGGGCGPLWPFGFSKSAYFGECGRREIVTQEMDSTRSW